MWYCVVSVCLSVCVRLSVCVSLCKFLNKNKMLSHIKSWSDLAWPDLTLPELTRSQSNYLMWPNMAWPDLIWSDLTRLNDCVFASGGLTQADESKQQARVWLDTTCRRPRCWGPPRPLFLLPLHPRPTRSPARRSSTPPRWPQPRNPGSSPWLRRRKVNTLVCPI